MLSDRIGDVGGGRFIDVVTTGWARERDSRIVSRSDFGAVTSRLWSCCAKIDQVDGLRRGARRGETRQLPLAGLRAAIIVAGVVVLELLCRTGAISRRVIYIAPSDMAVALWKILASGKFTNDIVQSFGCVLAALVLSAILGFAAGVALRAPPRLRRVLDPLFATYYAVPFFVFYPVLIALFGLNQGPVIAIAFLFAVVAMIINTLNGLDRIRASTAKVARVHHLTPYAAAMRLKLPAAAPISSPASSSPSPMCSSACWPTGSSWRRRAWAIELSYAYNNFDNQTMYGLMLLVMIVVTAVNMVLHVWEQRVLTRRQGRR